MSKDGPMSGPTDLWTEMHGTAEAHESAGMCGARYRCDGTHDIWAVTQ